MTYSPGPIPRPDFLGGGHWIASNFGPITVLLGRNGAGKSIFLRHWRSNISDPVHYINPERSGSITFDPNVYGQLINNQEMRSEQNIDTQYRQKASTSIQRYYTDYAVQNGDVLVGKDEFIELLNIALPNYRFELIATPPFWRGERLSNGHKIDNSDQLSSGESQILSMSMDILAQYSRLPKNTAQFRTLLIDEPDAHIHPDTQANFCRLISVFQKRIGMNVVIATHSVEIIGGLALHCPDRTACAILEPNSTEIRARPIEGMHAEALSALGGGVLMGRLFGALLLLVEGEDDHDVWSQAARTGSLNATVIPCGGGERMKKKQKLLEDLFKGLRDPVSKPFGIAILDADKKLPEPNPRNRQIYIKFERLKCHEIENLVLTDEVLAQIGLTWGDFVEKIEGWEGKSASKKAKLKKIISLPKKDVDLKGLMPTIESLIFPDMGRWTRIVGNILAKGRPTGELAEFIGEEILDAIYGQSLTAAIEVN
ncbi:AAA family ATPase [Novosphingobium sp. MW5]|nr:AAA family ATPase [Novosphingobium sp. MW5]